jgi:hypothetical protein
MSRSKRKVAGPTKPVNVPTDFWVVIPAPQGLTPEENALVEEGGDWPVRRLDHLPEHESLVDFLIERSVETWTRSQG